MIMLFKGNSSRLEHLIEKIQANKENHDVDIKGNYFKYLTTFFNFFKKIKKLKKHVKYIIYFIYCLLATRALVSRV